MLISLSITQTFTFVATVEAIVEAGATPVCVDIDETLNICPKSLESMITGKTKAVIAVHMLGGPARIEEIKIICDRYGLALIEDTAWGCGGSRWRRRAWRRRGAWRPGRGRAGTPGAARESWIVRSCRT